MFVCRKCVGPHVDDHCFGRSYGPCELCGKTGECADCGCNPIPRSAVIPQDEKMRNAARDAYGFGTGGWPLKPEPEGENE